MEHLSQKALRARLDVAAQAVALGGIYQHYKGDLYKALHLAIREEDNSVLVVYQAQYGERITFARPLESWLETVEWEGKTQKRFTLTP